jgi:molybdopterin synthase catalytic subunit/molybdopterin converting factor small subunit
MNISVLFFATLRDKSGTNRVNLELASPLNVRELKMLLAEKYPALIPYISSVIVSINREFAFDQDMLMDGAEVAIFPAVSGGSGFPTIVKITEESICLDDLLSQITQETTGAVCIFTGIVRAITSRRESQLTTHLFYEAYIPMAEAKMLQLVDEIRHRWSAVEGILIVQRIGRLPAGAPSVIIACAAAHRDTGVFEAARYGIDRLKEIVPVWKKEIGPHGEEWIEGKYLPGQGD